MKVIRYFALLIILLGYHHLAFAQALEAHAGVDTSFCGFLGTPAPDIYILGAIVPATGGLPSYTYHWDISPKPFINDPDYPESSTFFASEIIQDTTAANPTLYLSLLNNANITFVLTVTDAANNTAVDSMVIKRSDYSVGLGNSVINATTGDTQTITPGVFNGGIEPYTFDWGTSSYLIGEQFDFDVYSSESWPNRQIVIPQPSGSLHWQPAFSVTDAAGCYLSTGTYEMFIISPTSTEDADELAGLKLFPNPVENILYIQMPAAPILEFHILDITGKEVKVPGITILEDIGMLNTENLPSGIYVLQLKTVDGYLNRKFAKAD